MEAENLNLADQGRVMLAVQAQRQSDGRTSYPPRRLVFFLVRPSTGWMRLNLIIEGILLYLKFTDFNVNLI